MVSYNAIREAQFSELKKSHKDTVLLQGEIKDKMEYCKELTASNEKLQSALNKSSKDNKRLTVENAMFREVAKMENEMLLTKHGSIGHSISSTSDTSVVASGYVLPSRDSATMLEPGIINTISEKEVVPSWLQNEGLKRDGCHGQEIDLASKLSGSSIDYPKDKVQHKVQMSENASDAEHLDRKEGGGSQGKRSGTERYNLKEGRCFCSERPDYCRMENSLKDNRVK